MKKDITELVFILDRSGSMCGLESDTIGGFNSMLEKQKKEDGIANVTTVLFDDQYELLHDRKPISDVAQITEKEYYVGGCTALCDAIGVTITRMTQTQNMLTGNEKASKVLFVIITDGLENASREFSSQQVKKLVEQKRTKENWEFIFLGANIDAVETAHRFGIRREMSSDYVPDAKGTALNFRSVSAAVSNFRSTGAVDAEWADDIKSDYKKRNKKK